MAPDVALTPHRSMVFRFVTEIGLLFAAYAARWIVPIPKWPCDGLVSHLVCIPISLDPDQDKTIASFQTVGFQSWFGRCPLSRATQIYLIYTTEQLRSNLVQWPSRGSLAVLGFALATFWSIVHHLSYWAPAAWPGDPLQSGSGSSVINAWGNWLEG